MTGWALGSLGVCSPKQPNLVECGLFPLLLARCLWQSARLPPHLDEKATDALRVAHAHELMQSSE